jgi:hypothetical protein
MTSAEYFGKEGARVRSAQPQPTPAAPQIAVGSKRLAPCQLVHAHTSRCLCAAGFYHDWSVQIRALQRLGELGLATFVN